MKKIRYIVIFIGCIIFLLLIYFGFFYHSLDRDLNRIDFNKYNKLMIVAHPDDETLWGGGHLVDSDYVVVCVTCGKNKVRLNEIKRVLKKSDDKLIALWYPDKVFGKRSKWKNCYNDIYNDLDKVINSYDWDIIVTHNPQGEYGHIHHKMTNKIVTDIYNNDMVNGDLYYFGNYYTKSRVNELKLNEVKYNPSSIKEKKKMIDMYHSQSFIKKMFNQMTDYEDWQKYEKKKA